MKNKKFNVRHLFVIVAGLDKDCSSTIEEIYRKNKEEYNEIYLNSNFYPDMVKQIFSMKTEDRINKAIGIVEKCYKTNSFINIEKIIRGIHPSIVNFVKKSYKVDLEKFRLIYLDKKQISEEKLFCINAALIYCASLNDKQISFNSIVKFVMDKWEGYTEQCMHVDKDLFNMLAEVNPNITKFDESVLSQYYSIFDLKYNDIVDNNLSCFFDDFIEKMTLAKFGYALEDSNSRMDLDVEEYQKERNRQFTTGAIKYIGCFNRFIVSLGLDSSDLMNESIITNEVLNNVFSDFEKSFRYNNVPKSEKELYSVACLFIHNLVELYKESKDMYLNKAQEEKYTELKEQEKKLNEEKNIISKKFNLIEEKNKNQAQEIKELKDKIKMLEKENAKLNGIINKKNTEIENLNTENEEMKLEIKIKDEIISSKEDADCNIEDSNISFEEKIEYINKFKIGIFGGRNTIKNLNDVLCNVIFFDSKNQDISAAKNCDMIFINYKYFSHAFFKKLNANILNLNIQKSYIKETNIELIVDNIFYSLKSLNNCN